MALILNEEQQSLKDIAKEFLQKNIRMEEPTKSEKKKKKKRVKKSTSKLFH